MKASIGDLLLPGHVTVFHNDVSIGLAPDFHGHILYWKARNYSNYCMYCRPMYSVFTIDIVAYAYTHCFKITQNVEFEFWHFPPIFFLLKLTVWWHCLTASFRFSKTRQNGTFLAFLINCRPLTCKDSSLRSQCWMRLFLWFLNTVLT